MTHSGDDTISCSRPQLSPAPDASLQSPRHERRQVAVLPHEGTFSILYGTFPVPIGSGYRPGYLARPDEAGRFPVVFVLPGVGASKATRRTCAAVWPVGDSPASPSISIRADGRGAGRATVSAPMPPKPIERSCPTSTRLMSSSRAMTSSGRSRIVAVFSGLTSAADSP